MANPEVRFPVIQAIDIDTGEPVKLKLKNNKLEVDAQVTAAVEEDNIHGSPDEGTTWVPVKLTEDGEVAVISGYNALNPTTEEITAEAVGEIRGLSTDNKPVDVALYTFFLEMDTGNLYYFNHEGEWVLFD